MRQARALGCEHGVLQSPNLVVPETPLPHKFRPVSAVQTVRAAQTSLAANMKLGITGTRCFAVRATRDQALVTWNAWQIPLGWIVSFIDNDGEFDGRD